MKRRSDGWTMREDKLVLETVLAYIRVGKARLRAFEEVGEKIGRTPNAVAFRYNGMLLGKYRDKIKQVEKETIFRVHYGNRIPLDNSNRDKEVVSFYRGILRENERLREEIETFKEVESIIKKFMTLQGSKQSLAKGTSADDLGKN